MLLHTSFKENLIEKILDLPNEVFEGSTFSKSSLLANNTVVNAMWADYQKSIEEYSLSPEEAFVEAMKSVAGIHVSAPKTVEKWEFRVETPLGTLRVYAAADLEHPGVYIDLHRDGTLEDAPLAMVEFSADDADLPEGKGCLVSRVWLDAESDEYTAAFQHTHIEEFFQKEV